MSATPMCEKAKRRAALPKGSKCRKDAIHWFARSAGRAGMQGSSQEAQHWNPLVAGRSAHLGSVGHLLVAARAATAVACFAGVRCRHSLRVRRPAPLWQGSGLVLDQKGIAQPEQTRVARRPKSTLRALGHAIEGVRLVRDLRALARSA